MTKLMPSLSGKPPSCPFSVTIQSFSAPLAMRRLPRSLAPLSETASAFSKRDALGPERDAGLVAEADGVDFHLLVRIDAVGPLVVELDPHDGAAAGHLRLDDLPGLAGTPTGSRRRSSGRPTSGR